MNTADSSDIEFVARHFEGVIALWEDYVVTEASIAKQAKNIGTWLADDNFHLTVAKTEDGQRIGFNSLFVTKSYDGSHYGKIVILFVLPEFRKRGIARHLKLEGEEWLRSQDVRIVVTEIDAKNERMLEISRRAGFEIKSYTFRRELPER